MRTAPARAESGFSLPEVLVAMALLTVGIVGVGAALTVQTSGISSGATTGLAAVTRANSVAVAAMLAQERIEQMKAVPYSFTGPADQLVPANFPDEPYGAIPDNPGFRRSVTIQDNTPRPDAKTVTVRVFFRPPLETGLASEESVQIATIIARRP